MNLFETILLVIAGLIDFIYEKVVKLPYLSRLSKKFKRQKHKKLVL